MSAKKNKPISTGGLFSTLKTAVTRGRWLVVIAVFLIVVGVGWRLTWNRVRDRVLSGNDYHVNPQDIVISPLPAWIHTDVKREVIRDASLEGSLSVLEEDLTKRVANAFSLHPWVAKVHRVSKHHPARVEVQLTYRQPVAMIEVSGGLLAVDVEGMLLPSEDFSPAEAKKYPRIARIESHPAGPVGTSWGDVNVVGGAQIAAALGPRWQTFKFYRILAPRLTGALGAGLPTPPDVDRYTFELSTHAGTRIIWGRPPGSEPTGEAPAPAKIQLLDQIVAQSGSLDGPSGAQLIDLRSGNADLMRTAVQPSSTPTK